MSYIPIVSPSDRTQVSPRARELATQIEKVVQDFQRNYPDTRPGDVQQALRVASGGSDSVPESRRVLALTLAGGVAALVGVLFFMRESGGGEMGLPGDAMLWVVTGAILFVAVAALVRNR
jgi:hypothetical protein